MKKLLTILSSFGLIATTGASVVACKNDQSNSLQPKETENESLGSATKEEKKEETKLIIINKVVWNLQKIKIQV
ncbi:lipoprotein [Mycoplasma mycoides]|uniref:lipoprotein n=1 Tax=Mycoplasma mycoides TaxID=2102 RepID=UPI001ED95E9A